MNPLFPRLLEPDDTVALSFDLREVTYRELAWHAQRFLQSLEHLRLRPGDRAALFAQGQLATLVALVGCVLGEVTCALVDPRLDAAQRRSVLEAAGCQGMLAARPSALPVPGVHRVELSDPRRVERMVRLESPGNRVDPSVAIALYDVEPTGEPRVTSLRREQLAAGVASQLPQSGELARATTMFVDGLREGRVTRWRSGDVLASDG